MGDDFLKENKKPFMQYVLRSAFLGLILIYIFSLQQLFSQDGEAIIDSLAILFEKEKSTTKKIDILFELVDVYENWGEWDKYEEIVFQALKLSEEAKDSSNIAEAYNCLGISSCYQGKNKEAAEYFKNVIAINIANNDTMALANAYENIGSVYKDLGDYSNAVDCQLKSLELRRGTQHPRIFNNYTKLSELYGLLKQYEKLDSCISIARNILSQRENNDPSEWAIFFNQLGEIYSNRSLHDSSIVCYKKVIKYSSQVEWNRGIAVGLGNLADEFYKIGDLDSSIIYHKQSLQLSKKIEDCMSVAEEYLYLAELFDEKNMHDSVMHFANEGINRAKACDLLKELSSAMGFVASYQKSRGNFEMAYEYLEQYHTLIDSISSIEVKSNIAELETKYETKEKQQHIELLTQENQLKKQRVVVFISISAALLLAIFAGILLYFRKRKQNIFQQETLKQQLLRSQMNPHFLFNALGSIQNFMYKNETKKAAGYLNNFASLTRSILKNSAQETVPLSEEIETLRNYLELEKMRTMNLFDYDFIYSDELDTEFINIPPMFIQPFIENAIKHGFHKIDYKGELIVKIEEQGDELSIEISDNGKGIDSTNVVNETKHASMAMKIFSERKKLLEKNLKKQIYFEAVDKQTLNEGQKGTLIRIILPIN